MSYKTLKDDEVWCEYCDEYKVLKKDTKDALISEFVNDLKNFEAPLNSFPGDPMDRLIKKWEEKLK